MSGSGQQRRIVGRYRLEARLGRGGMGTVWRAYDELLGRRVAVKELHVDVGSAVHPTLREARAIARVHHPHIVCVHDVVEEDGVPYIVMELVEGGSLAERLASRGPLDAREAARIGLALLGALRAAHALGVLHRDLKPANVLLEEGTGRVVLTDFGIAQLAGSTTITEAGMFVGSPEYTAPERMQGAQAGPETDLWSLGALLCATLTGQSPFHRDSLGGVLHAVVEEDFRPPAAAGPLLPVVRGLLRRDPARRMGATEAERLLRAYAESGRPRDHDGGYEERGYEQRGYDSRPYDSPPYDSRGRDSRGRGSRGHGVADDVPSPYRGGPSGARDPYADAVPPSAGASGPAPSDAVPEGARSRPRSRTRHPARLQGRLLDRRGERVRDRPRARGARPDGVAVPRRTGRAPLGGLRTPLVAAVVLVALAGAGAAGVLLLRGAGDGDGGGDRPTASAPVSPTPNAPAPTGPNMPGAAAGTGTGPGGTPDPAATGSAATPGAPATGAPPASAPARVPAGYRSAADPRGFTLTVPVGYVRSADDRRVFYMSSDRAMRIGVRIRPPDSDGPLASMRRAHARGPEAHPGYRDARVTPTTHNGLPAALREFTWNGFSRSEGARRSYDICWDESGRMYDVWVSAPVARLDELKRHFDTVLDSFRVRHS
ncbi:serine/threonine-protein kinase [Streptomyces ficellus]|uniref:non-specific serine/threonine protein kinase n=1 Tax=Streptomyces ficellus TaxID=1977088 RepID=A0A6I6F7P0_9ACTN|nr:serine/threonine-protein kinase [Streptomyces ficellus]QGV79001.1 serine/threonine protein kinase [Streptomyces ficellus]